MQHTAAALHCAGSTLMAPLAILDSQKKFSALRQQLNILHPQTNASALPSSTKHRTDPFTRAHSHPRFCFYKRTAKLTCMRAGLRTCRSTGPRATESRAAAPSRARWLAKSPPTWLCNLHSVNCRHSASKQSGKLLVRQAKYSSLDMAVRVAFCQSAGTTPSGKTGDTNQRSADMAMQL